MGFVLARLEALLRSASEPLPHDANRSPLGPKRILLVDDALPQVQDLAAVLEAEGYDIRQARTGREALDLLPEVDIDAILLDILMPGLSALETGRLIKSHPTSETSLRPKPGRADS